MKYSLIIPVYKNEDTLTALLAALKDLNISLNSQLEVVFVVDGSPDQCATLLRDSLNQLSFPAQVLLHSRNFGAFAAIRTGLMAAQGEYFAVVGADLQEPPELLLNFFSALEKGECDVAIGTRSSRKDPFLSNLSSTIFWWFYKKFILSNMPEGGVDIFGCNAVFRQQLLQLEESRSSLIALIFWLGFKRKFISYERLPRPSGKSAWTFRKKIDYMMDNIFAFTDYPIRLLIRVGAIGTLFSILGGMAVFIARLMGKIEVPGYTTIVMIILIMGTLNLFALGLVGSYAWRAYENTKRRPLAIVAAQYSNEGDSMHLENKVHETVDASLLGIKPMEIGERGATLHRLPLVQDIRGDLSFGEFLKNIPFVPKRYFVVFNVPSEKNRGEHAHHQCQQFLVCVKGSCAIVLDDGKSRTEVFLDSPQSGVYIPPLVWGIHYKYSSDAVLLVFASEYYDAADYIRDYSEFMGYVK